jgi:hypothetical protein
MTHTLSKIDRARVGEGNLANIAAGEIARLKYERSRPYVTRRADILQRAVMLAADIEDLMGERPANVEKLTVQAARADEYPLRKALGRTRGLEAALRAL